MTKRTVKFLFMLSTTLVVMGLSAIAYAQDDTAVETARASAGGWIGLGAGLAIGLAALGGAIGQGRAASSFLDGVARNPGASDKVFVPLMLGLAFIESLVIFALLIAFMLQAKIG